MDAKLALSGKPSVWSRIASLRQCSLDLLAPAVRAAVIATLRHAHGQTISVTLSDGRTDVVALDPMVNETLRSDELQRIYFEQGTTKAATAEHSWHFYGLAADLISIAYGWFDGADARERWPLTADRELVADAWFRAIATIAVRFDLSAGIDWPTFPDAPHVQWSRCPRSPHEAPEICAHAGGGLRGRQAVWHVVGADIVPSTLAEAAA